MTDTLTRHMFRASAAMEALQTMDLPPGARLHVAEIVEALTAAILALHEAEAAKVPHARLQ